MKVQYPIVRTITIDEDVRFDIGCATGEIVGFIQGDGKIPDRFVVCDDKSGAFIKVDVGECCKFEEDVNS